MNPNSLNDLTDLTENQKNLLSRAANLKDYQIIDMRESRLLIDGLLAIAVKLERENAELRNYAEALTHRGAKE